MATHNTSITIHVTATREEMEREFCSTPGVHMLAHRKRRVRKKWKRRLAPIIHARLQKLVTSNMTWHAGGPR